MKTLLTNVCPGTGTGMVLLMMMTLLLQSRVALGSPAERTPAAPESAEAQYELGLRYFNGGFGVPKDFDDAVRWYRQAIHRRYVEAQGELGEVYTYGRVLLEDLAKNIMYEVDLCLGPPEDYTEAVKWFLKAAEQGYAAAQNKLGEMYFYGIGVPEDEAEAVRWYRKAAEQGHAEAQSNLGWMYANGVGVPEDAVEAVKWFRKAAEQGDAFALASLGLMYDDGWIGNLTNKERRNETQ